MSETVVRRGHDTWANSGATTTEYGSGGYIQLKSTTRRGFVYLPLSGVRGRTVLSATLAMHVRGTWAAQTLTVQRIASSWSSAALNWGNQPGVTGATATKVTGALVTGDLIEVDVTTQIQPVANGSAWYGFRVITSEATTTQKLASFDSGLSAWTLTVELSDAPEQPSSLAPDGGSVSSAKPILSWDFTDLGGSSTEQASLQVQIDPLGASGGAADFDSGEVVSVEPELDLTTTAYPGLASGATTQWRVRVKDGADLWSDWSDWATFTYTPKPTLTINQPTGAGLIYDPTPPIEASISSGTLDAWRIVVTKGTDRTGILYSSGVREATHATNIALTLPELYNGVRIFRDDVSYQIGVRAWDTVDRSPGVTADPTYVEAWRTVTFDDDVAVTAPAAFAVAQVGSSPRLTFTWTRAVDPDAWVILRDGKVYARLDAAEVPEPGGVYTWTDGGYAEPSISAVWTVKAVVANRQSAPSNTVALTPTVIGVWLITADGSTVVLNGSAGIDGFRTLDRRATYKPINVAHDVDIITGLEGVTGSFEGKIIEATTQTLTAALAVLDAIKNDPAAAVQLVFASKSIPVKLRHLTFLPSSENRTPTFEHNVSFEFWQTGDFDHELS